MGSILVQLMKFFRGLWLLLWAVLFEFIMSFVFGTFRLGTLIFELFRGRRLGLSEGQNCLGKGPVILIHGLNMDDFCMRTLKRKFFKEGWGPLYLLNLGKLSWTIEEQGQLLKNACEKIYKDYGRIHLVCHSMGGIVSRYYLQELGGGDKVASLVTIATPHFGTPMAKLAWSTSGRQMIPKSPFMHRLNQSAPALPKTVAYLFLWGNLDPIVPGLWGGPWSRKWGNQKSGAYQNLEGFMSCFRFIPYVGHMSILMARKTSREVLAFWGRM